MFDVKIRPATALDAVNLVRLLKLSMKETRASDLSRFSDDRALTYVLENIRESFVIVAELEGRLIGSLALLPIQEPWSDDWFMVEGWYFVVQAFRVRGVPADLLAIAETFCNAQRLPMYFGVSASRPPDLTQRFASRHGYDTVGVTYLRRPAPVQSLMERRGEEEAVAAAPG